eukprot:4314950-Pleurochrysis_carterae.AAC.2
MRSRRESRRRRSSPACAPHLAYAPLERRDGHEALWRDVHLRSGQAQRGVDRGPACSAPQSVPIAARVRTRDELRAAPYKHLHSPRHKGFLSSLECTPSEEPEGVVPFRT